MRHFTSLRQTPWEPQFKWIKGIRETAEQINRPHEDYPTQIRSTEIAILDSFVLFGKEKIFPISSSSLWLLSIHRNIFLGQPFAGKFREVNVTVGNHHPPPAYAVPNYMFQLDMWTLIQSTEDLIDYYYDFNTIHPFQDGNGRCSGVVVAILSSLLEPEKGYLAALQ